MQHIVYMRFAKHPPHQTAYSPETRKIVNRINAPVIELFGCRFDGRRT